MGVSMQRKIFWPSDWMPWELPLEAFAFRRGSSHVVNIVSISCYELEGPHVPGKDPKERLNRGVLFGSMKDDVLKTLGGNCPQKNS